jgi:hypothetical protein
VGPFNKKFPAETPYLGTIPPMKFINHISVVFTKVLGFHLNPNPNPTRKSYF